VWAWFKMIVSPRVCGYPFSSAQLNLANFQRIENNRRFGKQLINPEALRTSSVRFRCSRAVNGWIHDMYSARYPDAQDAFLAIKFAVFILVSEKYGSLLHMFSISCPLETNIGSTILSAFV
jgi:hypothetical protein